MSLEKYWGEVSKHWTKDFSEKHPYGDESLPAEFYWAIENFNYYLSGGAGQDFGSVLTRAQNFLVALRWWETNVKKHSVPAEVGFFIRSAVRYFLGSSVPEGDSGWYAHNLYPLLEGLI